MKSLSWIGNWVLRRRSRRLKKQGAAGVVREFSPPAQVSHKGRMTPTQGTLPHFRATADDQVDFRKSDPFSNIRMRLRRVFTPAQPMTDPQVFAGRVEILSALIRAIEESRLHVVLYGERGLGKTSILHILAQAARDARYLVIYVPCDANSSFDEVFRSIAARIPLLYHGGIGPTAPESERGQTLADILPPGTLTSRAISDGFANVVGTRVIVILDEFDRCASQGFRHGVAELLKNLSDRSVRVQLVIAGVAANLSELIDYIPSVQRNIFAQQLPRMAANETRQLVRKGESATGLHFDDAALAAIVSVANGFPYFASLLCHYAALHALDNARADVNNADVKAALHNALDELGSRSTRRSLAEISVCADAGHLPALGDLAGVSLLSGGVIDSENIRQFVSDPERIARCERLIELLDPKGVLIQPIPGRVPPAYRFIDENVLPYLWLSAAEVNSGAWKAEAAASARPHLEAAEGRGKGSSARPG